MVSVGTPKWRLLVERRSVAGVGYGLVCDWFQAFSIFFMGRFLFDVYGLEMSILGDYAVVVLVCETNSASRASWLLAMIPVLRMIKFIAKLGNFH